MAARPAVYPLVYGSAKLSSAGPSSPGVTSAMEAEQARFEAEAGVGELDETDPEYARRWAKARADADDRFRALFGWEAYAARQRDAMLREAAGGTPEEP